MDLKPGTNTSQVDTSLDKRPRGTAALRAAGTLVLRVFNAALVLATNLLAQVFGSVLVRRHFHLLLSSLLLFGPLLSLWVSKYSVFANSHNYLYR